MRSPLKNTAIFLQREINLILALDRNVTEKNIIYLAFRFLRMPLSSLFSIVGIKHHKINWERKGFISAYSCSPSLREFRAGAGDRNLEGGTETESVEEHC